MTDEIESYIESLESQIKSQNDVLQNQQHLQTQNSMIMQEQDKSIVKEQLELGEDLERIEHLIKGDIIKRTAEGDVWEAPTDRSMIIFSPYGVQLIMNAICFYINKNKLLSNYDEDTINSKMEDFGVDLTDTIFMESEKVFEQPTFQDCAKILTERINRRAQLRVYTLQILGQETIDANKITKEIIDNLEYNIEKELEKIKQTIMKDKYKRFFLIVRLITDTIHDTYLRALAGVERRSLRQHINISEVQTLGSQNRPVQKETKWYNPLSWRNQK